MRSKLQTFIGDDPETGPQTVLVIKGFAGPAEIHEFMEALQGEGVFKREKLPPSQMRKLERRLSAVWAHTSPLNGPKVTVPWRYVPKGINGGPDWQVFDMMQQRFLADSEILALPVEALANELVTRPS